MTPQPDPYRTLGLVPGASLNEIRSAYRRLAKLYHPDAAGERALARFLAIQAAYERLVDGEGRLRGAGGAGGAAAGGGAGGGPAREPWRADPERARASRDAWRARRAAGGGAAGGTAADPGANPAGAAAPRRERTGRPGPAAGTSPGGGPARRTPRKARPGSTSYDEATAPLDPSWQGGAWYGPSSGTYWTLNPREYADPRKHGPEYQARARRLDEAPPAEPASPPASGSPAPPSEPATAAPEPDLEALARRLAPRRLLALAMRPDRRWRVLLAIAGWPPIGYALASALLDSTGCSRFAATCPEPARLVALAIQPLVVVALGLVPVAAAVAAFASIAALAVALPVAAVLAVGTVPESRAGAPVLAAAVALAWAVAAVAGAVDVRRREVPGPEEPPPGP
jgi:curved DNA-binding protein CbpA